MKKVGHILYVASQSKSRQRLLELAHIPYQLLKHDSDESLARGHLSFAEYVSHIAQEKMRHLIIPNRGEVKSDTLFLLTADTLSRTMVSGHILGKPADKDDARRMLALTRSEPVEVVTACRLEKRIWLKAGWDLDEVRAWSVRGEVEFCVDEDMVDEYFERVPLALHCSGAGHIEDFGQIFLKSLKGSYSAVLGLPLYELRLSLKEMGFFS